MSSPRDRVCYARLTELFRAGTSSAPVIEGGRLFSLDRWGHHDRAVLCVRPLDGAGPHEPTVVLDPMTVVLDETAAIDWFHPSRDGDARRLRRFRFGRRAVDVACARPATPASTCPTRSPTPAPRPSAGCRTPRASPTPAMPPVATTTVMSSGIASARRGPTTPVLFDELPGPERRGPTCRCRGTDGYAVVHVELGWSRNDVHVIDVASGERRTVIADQEVVTWLTVDDRRNRLVGHTTLDADRGRVVAVPLDGDSLEPSRMEDARSRGRGGDRGHRVDTRCAARRVDASTLSPTSRITGETERSSTRCRCPSSVRWPDLRRPRTTTSPRSLHRASRVLRRCSDGRRRRGRPVERPSGCARPDRLHGVATRVPVDRRHRRRDVPGAGRGRTGGRADADHPHGLRRLRHRDVAGVQSGHRGVRRGWWLLRGRRASEAGTRKASRGIGPACARTSNRSSTTSTRPPTGWSREDITTRSQLAIRGGSNGGLLVGAAITQRPDLCRAAVCAVPLLDMVRYHHFLIARLWIPEYGDPDVADEFAWLVRVLAVPPRRRRRRATRRCSSRPVKRTAASTRCTRGSSRPGCRPPPRVDVDRPVLVRIEAKAGHGQGKPATRQADEAADVLAFVWWQLSSA